MADNGGRLPSPAVSDSAGTASPRNTAPQSINMADSQTSFILHLVEEKDRLVNEKHALLKEKDEIVTRLVQEKNDLVSSKNVRSQLQYKMLQEKDAEILRLKEENMTQKMRINGLAEALQQYIDQEAEEEDADTKSEQEDGTQEMDEEEFEGGPLDDVALGRFCPDKHENKRIKLSHSMSTSTPLPSASKSRHTQKDLRPGSAHHPRSQDADRMSSPPTCGDHDTVQRSSAPHERGHSLRGPLGTLDRASHLDVQDDIKDPSIVRPGGSEPGLRLDQLSGDTIQATGFSALPSVDARKEFQAATADRALTDLEHMGGAVPVRSPFPDDTLGGTALSDSSNPALDSLDDYISDHYPDFSFAPFISLNNSGAPQLGSMTDLPSAVLRSLQNSLETLADRQSKAHQASSPTNKSTVLSCGHLWMIGCVSSVAWTVQDPGKYACRTCFNQRRACFLWQGNGKWGVLPIPPEARDPALTYKDEGYYIVAYSDKHSNHPGVWGDDRREASRKQKRLASVMS